MSNPGGWLRFVDAYRTMCGAPAQSYDAFLGHLTTWAEANRIPCAGVRVGMIKRHVTGSGKAEKGAMITAARALGFDPKDDNEADALPNHILARGSTSC
jgi:hypothetical protein